jgi:amino acid permease
MIVSPKNAGLTSGAGNANASPWVIAIKAAGIHGLDHFINVRILLLPPLSAILFFSLLSPSPSSLTPSLPF